MLRAGFPMFSAPRHSLITSLADLHNHTCMYDLSSAFGRAYQLGFVITLNHN